MEMTLLWVGLLFVVLSQTPVIKCCVREEREALLKIKTYFVTNYNSSLVEKRLQSWVRDPKSDCCRWNRVKCHHSSGRVSILSLQALNSIHEAGHLRSPDGSMEQPYGNFSIDFLMFQSFKEITSLNFSSNQFRSVQNTPGTILS